MANRPKKKGTARETATVKRAETWPGIHAERAPNHAPSWDVSLRAVGLGTMRVEVKDRQQLNLHKTLADTAAVNDGLPVAVLWHRTSTKPGNSRPSPDGPTLVAIEQDLLFALWSMASLLHTAWNFNDHPGVVAGVWEDAADVVARLDERYPLLRYGGFAGPVAEGDDPADGAPDPAGGLG